MLVLFAQASALASLVVALDFNADNAALQLATAKAQVEIAVEGESAFRVSISHVGTLQRQNSRMLSDKGGRTAAFTVSEEDDGMTLSTAFGSVTLGKDASFVLRNAENQVLVQSQLLSSFDGSYLRAHLDKPKFQESRYYGAGAVPGAPLTVEAAQPWVYNDYGMGATSLAPQYYSSDGYAALAVASHDHSNSTDYWRNGMSDFGMYPVNWTSNDGGVLWMAEGPSVDLYLMPAADTYAYLKAHSELTGRARVPPRYAFGLFVGRWGWEDQEYIEEILHRFRDERFPADAFISDFEFFGTFNDYFVPTEGNPEYHDFAWNPVTFPEPKKQMSHYKELGFRMGGIRKPRFGNPEYLKHLNESGWLLPAGLDQDDYLAGHGREANFSSQGAKEWYAEQNQHYLEDGVSFWWNDEGEVYYFQFHDWNEGQLLGHDKFDDAQRFFSLNRVFTPGMQRLGAAVWTGDIEVSWEAMAIQPAHMNNLALSGNVYTACDTGGFAGGKNTSAELLMRWYWSSAFMPLMRLHSACSTDSKSCAGSPDEPNPKPIVPHFPFLYGEEAADAMRKAIETRYRLIPMLYSLAHEAYHTGAPITRPLLMEFASDSHAVNMTQQWLLGRDLMVAPVYVENDTHSVYFPRLAGEQQRWFEFNSTTTHEAGAAKHLTVPFTKAPMYCRPGSVLPLGPVVQHTGELPGLEGMLELHVYSGADGSFVLVEDDGESRAYEQGEVRTTHFRWNDAQQRLSWTVTSNATHQSMFRSMLIKVFSESSVKLAEHHRLGHDGSASFAEELVV